MQTNPRTSINSNNEIKKAELSECLEAVLAALHLRSPLMIWWLGVFPTCVNSSAATAAKV